MLIEIQNLKHIYMCGTPFETVALHDISLTIAKGEFIGIIGHTGSGKSTLVQHFNGLLKPTAGSVRIEGKDIWKDKIEMRQVRQKIGLLFQFPEQQLFAETVAEDVAFGPKNLDLPAPQIQERVREALEYVELGYNAIKERSPFNLSGGEKRRVALAGVLAMRPQALILDEPTAGLDPAGRKHLLKLIQRLHLEAGKTIIMVTHNMEEVARLASRLFILHQGKLTMEGNPAEIFSSGQPLEKLGLSLPVTVALMQKLKEKGKKVKTNVFSLEEAKQEILAFWKKEGKL